MSPPPSGPMAEEILETPALFTRLVDRLAGLVEDVARRLGGETRSTSYVGCGDMSFAAECVAAFGRDPSARGMVSMDARWRSADWNESDLVVLASVSGRTPRTIEAAERAQRAKARTIAITGSPGAGLGNACEATIGIEFAPPADVERHAYPGYRNAIAQTQSYAGILLAELMLDEALRSVRFGEAPDWQRFGTLGNELGDRMESVRTACESAVRDLGPNADVVFLGSGPWRGPASYAAAKWLEFTIPARAQCIEEYAHLEMFVASRETCLVWIAPDAASAARTSEAITPLARLGTHRVAMAEPGAVSLANADAVPRAVSSGDTDAERAREVRSIDLAATPGPARLFEVTLAAQWLALYGAMACGRDVTRWLGGVRTDFMTALGADTIRASRSWNE